MTAATAATDRRPRFDSAVATGKGDDGTTGLLYGGERIAKDDLRTEAYGTIDEAVAALGLAAPNWASRTGSACCRSSSATCRR